MPLTVAVQDVRRGTQKHITASCEVTLTTEDGETITIVDVRVMRNRSGDLWICFPSTPVHDFEGIKYVPDMHFSKDLKRRITDIVLAEFEKDDAQHDVRAEQMQCPAVRPAVKAFREALVTYGRGNNAR
jgi:DNA-binding cell septation regulator SpoVG